MKKKWLVGLMALCMSFATVGFVGCGETPPNDDDTNTEQGGDNTGNNNQGGNTGGGTIAPTKKPSQGLDYTLSEDKTYYIVTGIGTCTDANLVIPNTYDGLLVKEIGKDAFEYCSNLISVVIGDSVEMIGNYAFGHCYNLLSIVIGDSVQTIDMFAFQACYKLVEVVNKSPYITVEKGYNSLGYVGLYALAVYNSDSGVTESQLTNDNGYIIYTDGEEKILVNYIGEETDLTLPTYITQINRFALYKCNNLTNVVIGDNVTSIGSYAVSYCLGLTSIMIPDRVETIGDYAFYACYKLVEVVNKSPYITVEKGAYYDYVGCYALTVYNSTDTFTGTKLSNDNGYIIYTDGEEKVLVRYEGTETDLMLPTYITKINRNAFYFCDNLTSVVIGDNVQTIDHAAFDFCDNSTSVIIGDSVTLIDSYAFAGCSKLTDVYYKGTVSEWNDISINRKHSNDTSLINTTRYYYIEKQTDVPNDGGNYWHYVDGVPTKW